ATYWTSSPTISRGMSSSRSTRIGRTPEAPTSQRCWSGSATASSRSTSRTATGRSTRSGRSRPARASSRSRRSSRPRRRRSGSSSSMIRTETCSRPSGRVASSSWLPMADAARTGPVGIGVIGAGNISSQYLQNLTQFPDTRVLAVGDAIPDVARAKAAEHGVPVAGDASVVVGHPEVEIVVNLTIPAAHAEIAERAIAAGKHVWNEKPLAADLADARRLLAAADRAGVRVGGAPDTFLGAGLQAVRRLVDEGAVGPPLTALALMQSPSPDAGHPNPAFLFQDGAGPLFDIGPYSLTALVQVFGPVASVAAVGSTARPRRVVGSGPRAGETFEVTAPSHVGALIRFESGGSAQAIFSFDSPQERALLEITGADAMIVV